MRVNDDCALGARCLQLSENYWRRIGCFEKLRSHPALLQHAHNVFGIALDVLLIAGDIGNRQQLGKLANNFNLVSAAEHAETVANIERTVVNQSDLRSSSGREAQHNQKKKIGNYAAMDVGHGTRF